MGTVAATSGAYAADLPLKAPPVVVAWNWSGFYLGGNIGYGWGQNPITDINDGAFAPGVGYGSFDPEGFLGGFHAGANWQTGRVVVGLEGDLSFADVKGSSQVSAGSGLVSIVDRSSTVSRSGTIDLLGSGRARFGYLVTPNVLIYGTGGAAFSDSNRTLAFSDVDTFVPPFRGNGSRLVSSNTLPTWRIGWVAGLGVETRLLDSNWLARLEYLHYDLGNSGGTSGWQAGVAPSLQNTGDLTVDVVRTGLTYKFDPDQITVASSTAPLYYKAPATAPQPWTWTGFYLGGHAGYGTVADPFTSLTVLPTAVSLNGFDSHGFVGGFQAGANWQSGALVGGLEIDLSGAHINGSASPIIVRGGSLTESQTDTFDRIGSARARLGYLITPSLLLYGTAGLGWTRFTSEQDLVSTSATQASQINSNPAWLFGWVAGTGIEARLWNTNWLARLEYLHYDFGQGSSSEQFTAGIPTNVNTSGRRTADIVRTGLSYKFDWPGYSNGGASVMPVKAAAAVWSWSGFYLGAHAGYGFGSDPLTEPLNGGPLTFTFPNSEGYVAGFQAGANWQTSRAVGGLEIDLSGTGIKGTSTATIPNFLNWTGVDKVQMLSSARARLGYLVTPDILLYGTGGLGWTEIDRTLTVTLLPNQPFSIVTTPNWRFGWVAGVGGETRLWNTNWLARLEYLHYDFGSSNEGFSAVSSGSAPLSFNSTISHHQTADVVRAGFDYKLN